MDAALAGDHPVLEALRKQLELASVREREMTGVGFFLYFEKDPTVAPAPTNRSQLIIEDVGASIEGLESEAQFLVFVTDGYLDLLEGYCNEGNWPQNIDRFEVMYSQVIEKTDSYTSYRYQRDSSREFDQLEL